MDIAMAMGSCNVSRIPDCPMSAALRLHAGGCPPWPPRVPAQPGRAQLTKNYYY